MARTVTVIQNQIKAEIAADPDLSTLATSTSKVAEWNLWTRVIARIIYFFEVILDAAKVSIQNLVASQKPGIPDWLVSEAKKFQLGDSLEVINGVITYADTTSDAALAKQIVKRASWSLEAGRFKLKIATEDSDGLPIPITGTSKTAFDFYMDRKKFAGMDFDIESKYADKLTLSLTVYHDPLVIPSDLDSPINEATVNYLRNINFGNGLFLSQALFDKIQAIEGITTLNFNTLSAKFNNGLTDSDYSGSNPIDIAWRTRSGYIKLDGTITIIYQPDTVLYVS